MLGLIRVQTVCKGYQQTTLVGIELTMLILYRLTSTLANSENPDQMTHDNQDLDKNNLQGHKYMIL